MTENKKQHYVPKNYIKNFSIRSDNKIWVYDKKYIENKNPIQLKSTKQICYEDHYYNQEDSDAFDKAIKTVEDSVSELFKNIKPQHDLTINLTLKQQSELSFWIALQMIRVPSFRDPLHQLHRDALKNCFNTLHRNKKLPPPPKNIDPDKDITFDVHNHVSLPAIAQCSETISKAILDKNWEFFYINDHELSEHMTFITGDNPVIVSNPIKVPLIGPAHPMSQIILPIRKDIALICTPLDNNHMCAFQAKKQVIDQINKGIVFHAKKYIISPYNSD